MKLNLIVTALAAVLALGSACQTPAEARHHYNNGQAQYNTAAYKRQLWEQNQAALMRRNRQIQNAQKRAVNNRYNNYNNRDHHHHGHYNH